MPIFDIETDGLLDEMTKVHVLSWMDNDNNVQHTHDYVAMRIFFEEADILVGHNIIRFDIPAVEKLLGVKIKAKLVDTLALSWYLNHDRLKHGLEGFGEDYGVPKPKIADWDNLSPEEYAHRCNEDVKINARLYRDLMIKMKEIYGKEEDMWRMVDYLTFKMECAREQEALQWKLDVEKAKTHLGEWAQLKEEKTVQLSEAMPEVVKYRTVNRPAQMYKKNGETTVAADKWYDLCAEYRKHPDVPSIEVVHSRDKGNPNSNDQVKSWLNSLGWEPRTFKFTRNKITGEEKSIAQVRRDSELCPSVIELAEREPAISLLDGLSVLTHRIGIIKSMVESENNGYVRATIAGFTNTLRFRHARPLVNLPSVDKPYGAEIRGCLTAPEGYTLCGADMTSLEDTTKRHYMKPLDPDYVAEMSKDGFDPHLDLAKHAGVITQDDIDKHNSGERSLKALRKNYKVVNYSATYGVGAAKLARETGMDKGEAQKLLDAFWNRNWSVQKTANGLRVIDRRGSMWLQNPVSGFWYSLRSDKDRFSTLNQGTGVFCFDSWVKECRGMGLQTIGQFHDEVIVITKEGDEDAVENIMNMAISNVNQDIQLNVNLGIDVQFGNTYAKIH